jgi:hypothetical protein
VKRAAVAALATAAALQPGRAAADPPVTPAGHAGPVTIDLAVDYAYTARRSTLKRELAGLPGVDPGGPTPLVKDLVFRGSRHEVRPRVELGVPYGLHFTLGLPVALRDVRRLDFDQRADGCVFASDPGRATCVDATNSTAVADGLLPADGIDVDGGGAAAGGATVFRGATRAGLDQLHAGASWNVTDQARDPSKPTWTVGAELRLAIGDVMKIDAARPARDDGVSRGVHELRAATALERRLGPLAMTPRFEAWWLAPIAARDDAPLDPPAGAGKLQRSQNRAGADGGVEIVPWERPDTGQRVAVALTGGVAAHFAGRAYSDLWEVFALAGGEGGPLVLDADPGQEGMQPLPHPGVTTTQEYLSAAGRLAVDVRPTGWLQLDLAADLAWEQTHLVSFARGGALFAPVIDQVGHRYRVDEGLTYALSGGVRIVY